MRTIKRAQAQNVVFLELSQKYGTFDQDLKLSDILPLLEKVTEMLADLSLSRSTYVCSFNCKVSSIQYTI